jgi:hypothetical protein
MTERPESQSTSEQVVKRMLRDLPPRHAPATLALRVLREVERRHAEPWWRRGFARWPRGARAAFVALCAAAIALTAQGGVWAIAAQAMMRADALSMSWTQPAVAAMSTLGALAAWLIRVVPPAWVYGAMTAGTALYVALFGLGAAAYRLYLAPSTSGDPP